MSAKAIYEANAKDIVYRHVKCPSLARQDYVVITKDTDWNTLQTKHSWLSQVCLFFSIIRYFKLFISETRCQARSAYQKAWKAWTYQFEQIFR